MSTKMLDEWSDAIHTAFAAMVKIAGTTGDVMDQIAQRQLTEWSTCALVGTKQILRVWKALIHNRCSQLDGHVRVAVVIGGVGSIGTAICTKLAEAGNKVVATYIASEQNAAQKWQSVRRSEGYDISTIECDITSFESCTHMAEMVKSEFGAVDILVNCAGITHEDTLCKINKQNWHTVLDTNLDSVFNVTKNFIEGMIERHYGRIINISSINAQKSPLDQMNYSANKAGMIGFTKSLARELADQGITVNTVSPGYGATNMITAIPEEIRKSIINKIPVGCLDKPEEIAQVVAFLAAEESSYITGTDITVNGGLSGPNTKLQSNVTLSKAKGLMDSSPSAQNDNF